ncbi:MAG: hypothetical protein ACXWU2_14940 [Allosphingosinicella sp.]
MKAQMMLATGLAVMLPGCGEEPAREPQPIAVAETATDYARRLEALPEGQRNAVFIRAIRDDDRECQHVERSVPRAPVNGAPAWTATCERGTEWIILLFDSGDAQVLSPAELEAAGAADNVTANASP